MLGQYWGGDWLPAPGTSLLYGDPSSHPAEPPKPGLGHGAGLGPLHHGAHTNEHPLAWGLSLLGGDVLWVPILPLHPLPSSFPFFIPFLPFSPFPLQLSRRHGNGDIPCQLGGTRLGAPTGGVSLGSSSHSLMVTPRPAVVPREGLEQSEPPMALPLLGCSRTGSGFRGHWEEQRDLIKLRYPLTSSRSCQGRKFHLK